MCDVSSIKLSAAGFLQLETFFQKKNACLFSQTRFGNIKVDISFNDSWNGQHVDIYTGNGMVNTKANYFKIKKLLKEPFFMRLTGVTDKFMRLKYSVSRKSGSYGACSITSIQGLTENGFVSPTDVTGKINSICKGYASSILNCFNIFGMSVISMIIVMALLQWFGIVDFNTICSDSEIQRFEKLRKDPVKLLKAKEEEEENKINEL